MASAAIYQPSGKVSHLLGMGRYHSTQRTKSCPVRISAAHHGFSLSAFARRLRNKIRCRGGHVHRYEKLLWKREAALESWSLKIERHLAEVCDVWAFVSNHFEGFAPETCQRLARRLGFDLPLPSETENVSSKQELSQLDLQL